MSKRKEIVSIIQNASHHFGQQKTDNICILQKSSAYIAVLAIATGELHSLSSLSYHNRCGLSTSAIRGDRVTLLSETKGTWGAFLPPARQRLSLLPYAATRPHVRKGTFLSIRPGGKLHRFHGFWSSWQCGFLGQQSPQSAFPLP